NASTELALAVKRLLRRRAWALTGTPLENRLEDLASILEFAQPRRADQAPTPVVADMRLREALGDIQLRRRKREVLPQLPPKTVTDLDLELTGSQRSSYARAEADGLVHLASLGSEVRIANVLELILRLKQICNFDPETGASSKADDLEERIAQV
ncbi:SNF2-related protein, partial [mine drainage metagenome]